MKTTPLPAFPSPGRLTAACLALTSAIALGHPGHHHPAGTDRFDAFRANFFHLHGALEISLVLVALAAGMVLLLNRKRSVRIAAAITFGGSLALLAAS